MKAPKRRTVTRGVSAAAAAVVSTVLIAAPAHAGSRGYSEEEVGVGFFYGTFDEDPNLTLLVGGRAEDFCLDNPEDPFNAEPGSARARMFERGNGVVKEKINDKGQPIYLYETEGDGPSFIEEFCDVYFDEDPATTVPEPVASGSANLKVRNRISGSTVDVFNSVRGFLEATDGTEYKVRASADLVVEDGVPVGDPADFVSFRLKEIRC
ncbi:MAG: hypothetical protein WA892_03610 [Ornithinimicrobium sp.]